jgi:hypothetical protein
VGEGKVVNAEEVGESGGLLVEVAEGVEVAEIERDVVVRRAVEDKVGVELTSVGETAIVEVEGVIAEDARIDDDEPVGACTGRGDVVLSSSESELDLLLSSLSELGERKSSTCGTNPTD